MKNKYEIRGDITVIFIDSPKYGMKETIISTKKLSRVHEYVDSWYVRRSSYTKSFYILGNTPKINGKRKSILLHRWVTSAPSGMLVDHINRDTLNNLDENLRICTKAENNQNLKGARSHNKSSGIRGVSWHKATKKWRSRFTLNGIQHVVGHFDDLEEATSAVVEARMKHMTHSMEI